MATFEAIVFDLDGTLVDTEGPVIEAGVAALEALGFPGGHELLTTLVGIDQREGERRLTAHFGPALDLARLDALWHSGIAAARRDRGIATMAGAEVLLGTLARNGTPRAVATNTVTSRALAKLDLAGIAHHFDRAHIVGLDAVVRAKPAPDLYVEAARRLGAAAERCLAFEDSDTGAAAALAAGMTVVQIPDRQPTRARAAHHLAETLLEGARMAGILP